MAAMRYLHIFIFFFRELGASSSYSCDVKLLLEKVKLSLQSTSENLLLSSWNSSVPVCQWRGVKWVFSDGSPLHCTDLSSPQWTNFSLFNDSTLHLLSLGD
ncbi:Leucine-rich repeat-containing N-terminal plant-type [Arabidopsis suecica]|uniref:Leucine-rich repeat-containing N-terminal plant-type n=1 Tax=Arabidopsis suecica TaxID=45249 RepID=A0A8T1YP94_ARASU|nr:Leucine-rich repeat-containing N-terminal plant-type [Arabidopsis suecica]